MDRKFANFPGWARILQNRFYCTRLDSTEFKGYITLYCMDCVREPLVVQYFQRPTCIVDSGYAWLKQFPANEHFTVTTQYNADAQVVAWYIDICLRTGVGQDTVPWMDDLYLDLVVSPEMEIEVKDADELFAARDLGAVTAAEFDLAWSTLNRVKECIARNEFVLFVLSHTHRQILLKSGADF